MTIEKSDQISHLPLDQIEVRDRVRPVNEAAVQAILQSAEAVGGITSPIHVRKVKGAFQLIDGGHRLEVARRRGDTLIAARIWTCTDQEARLMEADANLSTAHASALDLAVSLSGRKRAYEALHPETKAGVFGGLARQGQQRTEMSFAEFIGEVLGVTPRQIRRIVAAGDALAVQEVARLRQAPRRIVMDDLYHIARIGNSGERMAVVDALAEGRAKTAAAARRAFAAEAAGVQPTLKDPVEEAFLALCKAWDRAPKAARRRFVEERADGLKDLLDASIRSDNAADGESL
ncbi:ParB N-terminal domain-containing protein [Paracoccaceae bacterium Fryx2]|nr:ParB N-terminal domain-containing protein [Paracoccaceae bacterium Fryx2]